MMPLPTDYGQRLPAWATMHYGLPQAAATSTIGEYGCKLCCYALILDQRPDVLQKQFAENHVYKDSGTFNFIVDDRIPLLYPHLVYHGRYDCPDDPAPLSLVDEWLTKHGFLLTYVYVKTT